MRIVGIDPAPSKGLHVFDGQHAQVPVEHCRAFLAELESSPNVLLCWDAPLTGPSSGTVAGNEAVGRDFTQRLVESFFRKASTGFKAPKGVSVLGYAGCPHWTLGRSLMDFLEPAHVIIRRMRSLLAWPWAQGPHVLGVTLSRYIPL